MLKCAALIGWKNNRDKKARFYLRDIGWLIILTLKFTTMVQNYINSVQFFKLQSWLDPISTSSSRFPLNPSVSSVVSKLNGFMQIPIPTMVHHIVQTITLTGKVQMLPLTRIIR